MIRIAVCLVSILLVLSCQQKGNDPSKEVSELAMIEVDSLVETMLMLKQQVESDKSGVVSDKAQQLFIKTRKHYKHIESLAEFHFPGVSETINGPALPETEEYDDKVQEPTGFQVIEEMLFPAINVEEHERLVAELNSLVSILNKLKEQFKTNSWVAPNIFEASRLQFLRIISLGITGFDSPIAFQSLPEAKEALIGLEKTVLCFSDLAADESTLKNMRSRFAETDQYLAAHTDFNSFNRAEFIVDYLNPLSQAVYTYQKSCGIANNKWLTAVDMTQFNFASVASIQAEWFVPSFNRDLANKEEVAALGKLLFFDPVLSGNNSRACASCHQPQRAFADGKIKSLAFDFEGSIERNAPTVINAGYQKNQFADSRVHFIEDQITDVITNTSEMHGQIVEAATKINTSEEYANLFKKAFNTQEENAVTKERIQVSIATYIRSLTGFNSKVDNYLEGNKHALSKGEIAGFNLFMGKGKCATCHFMPLFNGSVPTTFTETESEILGVPLKPDTINAQVDPDVGKLNTYKRELHKNAFKTPTVRNVALTAPYMHNGVYASLEEVIDFYNRGGGVGIGIELSNQTLPPDPLQLTTNEKKELIEFLSALTDTVGLTSVPKKLPLFKDRELDKRKIGGNY